ncbi:phosphoribosyltransferase [Komagataeibacter kakiaceti JCM 25156]|uniref:phosphoribosyltransferase n=1 Tax=Komagataeibacter kakiaceti TaxID=943261 RepID=UPI0006866A2E|nr:phosphoribosyltransferase family protein [Komagataeibacter kakiaceti]
MELAPLAASHPVILALPRGGVPVASEVAKALDADMDLLFVRKIGLPGQEEYGFGAVVDGASPQVILDDAAVRKFGIDARTISDIVKRQLAEIARQRRLYVNNRRPTPVTDQIVIVIDDGIATGGTMLAALRAVRQNHPARLVLAVPVAPSDILTLLAAECDQIVCPLQPHPFYAVGAYYRDFPQVEDSEVIRLVTEAEPYSGNA